MTTLLEFGHELGLPLRGRQHGFVVGWTTDKAKADTMQGAGATVTFVPAARGRWATKDTKRYDGWEIRFEVGAAVTS